MNSQKVNSPIMIAGMHRSGTSMVTKILKECGLEIGSKLDANSESIFFQRINIWMMSLMGSSWDSPKEFDKISSRIKDDIAVQIRELLDSRSNSIYLGWGSLIKKGSFNDIKTPWGWKDPRNTFTSLIWRDIFPGLKTVYIIRHPIDTVASLMKRQKTQVEEDIKRPKKYSNILKAILSISHTNYNSSMILNSFEDAFLLTESYYNKILEDGGVHSKIVKYEDILINPEDKIKEILDFCEIDSSSNQLNNSINSIDSSRAFAYRKNSELIKYETSHQAIINRMSYEN